MDLGSFDLGSIDFGSIWSQIQGVFKQIQPYLSQVGDFFKKTPSLFMALLMFFTVLFDPAAAHTDTSRIVNEEVYVLTEAMVMGQGITNDGEYFYTSGCITAFGYSALAKYDMKTKKQVKKEEKVIPDVLKNKGCDHIGGLSYYNGKIYAAVEDSKAYKNPYIVIYDAATLKYVTHYNLHPNQEPGEHDEDPLDNFQTRYQDGVPWVVVNPETGMLYASYWSHPNVLYKYDVNATMAYMGAINLTGIGELDRVQGGEFYGGKLYLSQDNSGAVKNVLKVNVYTGDVSLAFTRNIGKPTAEAEDLTICQTSDGGLFHTLDYNKVISVYLRSYDADVE